MGERKRTKLVCHINQLLQSLGDPARCSLTWLAQKSGCQPHHGLSLTFPFQCTGQVGVGFIFRHFADVTLKLQIQVVTQKVPHLSSTLNRIPQGSLNQRVVCGPRILQPQEKTGNSEPSSFESEPIFLTGDPYAQILLLWSLWVVTGQEAGCCSPLSGLYSSCSCSREEV